MQFDDQIISTFASKNTQAIVTYFSNDVLNEIVTLLGHLIPYYRKRICKPPEAVQLKLFVFIFV